MEDADFWGCGVAIGTPIASKCIQESALLGAEPGQRDEAPRYSGGNCSSRTFAYDPLQNKPDGAQPRE